MARPDTGKMLDLCELFLTPMFRELGLSWQQTAKENMDTETDSDSDSYTSVLCPDPI